jgi:hypothetical protein
VDLLVQHGEVLPQRRPINFVFAAHLQKNLTTDLQGCTRMGKSANVFKASTFQFDDRRRRRAADRKILHNQ